MYVYIYICIFFFKVEKQIGECASICKQLFVEFQVGNIHLIFSVFNIWIFIEMHYVVDATLPPNLLLTLATLLNFGT